MDINNMEINNTLLDNIETPTTLLSALLHRFFQILSRNTLLKMVNMMTFTYYILKDILKINVMK